MEQSTAYLIMILFPIIPCFLKLTISYKIRYKTPKVNVDKFYKKIKPLLSKNIFILQHPLRLLQYTKKLFNKMTGCKMTFLNFLQLWFFASANFLAILAAALKWAPQRQSQWTRNIAF